MTEKTMDVEQAASLEGRANVPYLAGRLLAEVEAAQEMVRGRGASTVADKYYRLLSASPRSILPRLLERYRDVLRRLRRTNPAAAGASEGRVAVLVTQMGDLPERFSLEQRGVFGLGYYHEKAGIGGKK